MSGNDASTFNGRSSDEAHRRKRGGRRKSSAAQSGKVSASEVIARIALKHYVLGRTKEDEPFAVRTNGPNVALMFRGSKDALRASLARDYRRATGRVPSAAALADALNLLAGEALGSDPSEVHLRVAEHRGNIIIDLGDQSGRAILINAYGWRVVDCSPVLFKRTALTAAMPEPTPPGDLSLLRTLLNVSDQQWRLLVGWLASGLMPEIAHPLLMLGGEQGTGKSTAAKLLVGLVDPSSAELQSEPLNPEAWAMTAAGSWAVCVDNVSRIPVWWSDALCRAVTGDAWVRRRLYSDCDLSVLKFRRLVLLTSIDAGALRGDLGDRLLLADLEPIPETLRQSEREIMAQFDLLRPKILAGLLDVLVAILRETPNVHLSQLPRMADFAMALAAMDIANGVDNTDDAALNIYLAQRSRIAGDVVDADPVASAIVDLVEGEGGWSGTAAELLIKLQPDKPGKFWPSTAQGLGGRIRRIAPALLKLGVEVERGKAADRNRTRLITITKRTYEADQDVQSSEPVVANDQEVDVGEEAADVLDDSLCTFSDDEGMYI